MSEKLCKKVGSTRGRSRDVGHSRGAKVIRRGCNAHKKGMAMQSKGALEPTYSGGGAKLWRKAWVTFQISLLT